MSMPKILSALGILLLLVLLTGVNSVSAATPTSMVLTSNPTNPDYGLSATLVATLNPSTAKGTVFFYIDGDPVGSATVLNGKAKVTWAVNKDPGSHTLTASFVPSNGSFDPSTASSTLQIDPGVAQNLYWASAHGGYVNTPSDVFDYHANFTFRVLGGDPSKSRVIFWDEDLDVLLCDVPGNPYTTVNVRAECDFPLSVGTHHLSAQVVGNYTSPKSKISIIIQALFP